MYAELGKISGSTGWCARLLTIDVSFGVTLSCCAIAGAAATWAAARFAILVHVRLAFCSWQNQSAPDMGAAFHSVAQPRAARAAAHAAKRQ